MSHSTRACETSAACFSGFWAGVFACLMAMSAAIAQGETPAPAAAQPAADQAAEKPAKPPEGKKMPPARKLTEEEILELPILHRYELSKEKLEILLSDVKDHTFDYDEPAFYALAAFVSKQDPEAMKPTEQDEDMDYSQLLSTPSSFRGRPVTIRGAYMTVTPWRVPVVALSKDVPRLYTCTIRELPLEKSLPVATVIVMEDPMTYLTVENEVRVKGYFYKVRDYQGNKGPGQAPMILAQRLEPVEPGTAGGGLLNPARSPLYLGVLFSDPRLVVMVAAVLLMIIGFFYLRLRNRSAKVHAKGKYPFHVHRFRLRRDGGTGPLGPIGPGSSASSPKPQGGPDQ